MDSQNNKLPLLSVCMVTYNHEKWIGQAIEGVLLQQTDFNIELVIGEDCSTDDTTTVIKLYQTKYPELIKAYFNETNQGLAKNFSETLNKCRGKYIAICEGDDFWNSPDKLAKQVQFLESNPEYIMCSHNSTRLHEADQSIDPNNKFESNFTYNQEMFIREWVTQPLTCVVRNFFSDYTYFNKENMFCDMIIFYEFLKHGLGYFMADNMSTFRVHQTALSSGLSNWQWNRNHVTMYDYLYKYNPTHKLLQNKSALYCLSLYIDELKNPQNKVSTFNSKQEYFKRASDFKTKFVTLFCRLPFYTIKYKFLGVK